MLFTLVGARLVDDRGELASANIVVSDATIAATGALPAHGMLVDVTGHILTPGFIDVHTHGGGGHALHTDDPAEIARYARWAPSTGTTAFLVTVVGVPGGLPLDQLHAAAEAIESQEAEAEILGIHLEGPYLNPVRRGAHDPAWLRLPDPSETEQLLEVTRGHLRIVTLAPELPGAAALIRRLVDDGVTVSIGHTDATYEQTRQAIDLGASHATHCFNAMPALLHRVPGPLGAVIDADHVRGELIADGVHVLPPVMRALIRALGPARTVIITDAQSPAGLGEVSFTFAGRLARVVNGAARLTDGTLAGSVLTMDQALRNLRHVVDLPLPDSVTMLTRSPARALGVEERKGRLAPGYDADLLLFDTGLSLQAAFCRGALVFATDAWRKRLRPLDMGSGTP